MVHTTDWKTCDNSAKTELVYCSSAMKNKRTPEYAYGVLTLILK